MLVGRDLPFGAALRQVCHARFDVREVAGPADAIETLQREPFDLVVARLGGRAGALRLLEEAARCELFVDVVAVDGEARAVDAVEAMRAGALDVIVDAPSAEALALRLARLAAFPPSIPPGAPGAADAARDDMPAPTRYVHFVEDAMEHAARRYLVSLVRRHRGNVSRAAVEAGLHRESLHRLLRRHGIRAREFRVDFTDDR